MKNNTINKYSISDRDAMEKVYDWACMNLVGFQHILDMANTKPGLLQQIKISIPGLTTGLAFSKSIIKYLSDQVAQIGIGQRELAMIKLEHYNNDLGLLHNALNYFDQISAFEHLNCKSNVLDRPGDIHVFVHMLDGTIISFQVSEFEDILRVKSKIQLRVGTPPEQQQLFFNGQELKDNEAICNYPIQNKSRLNLIREGFK